MCVFVCLSHVDQSRERENNLAPCIVSDVTKDKMTKVEVRLGKYKKEHIFPEYSEVFVASNRNMYYSALASIDGYVPSFTLSQPLIIHLTSQPNYISKERHQRASQVLEKGGQVLNSYPHIIFRA